MTRPWRPAFRRGQMPSPRLPPITAGKSKPSRRRVASELASRHIQVTSRVSHVLNALFVSAPGHSIDELRAIPGVKSVTPMRRTKADLNRAVQLMDAQTAWNAVGGQSNAGKGIKIAILDSGIDLTNPAFQDSSLTVPSGFPLCSGFPGSQHFVQQLYQQQGDCGAQLHAVARRWDRPR